MKKIFIFCAFILSQFVYAQDITFVNYHQSKKAKLVFPNQILSLNNNALAKQQIDLSTIAKQYLLANLAELKLAHTDLKLTNTYKSLIGTHFQFVQTYLASTVYQSNVKIALNANGQIINIINDLADLTTTDLPTVALSSNLVWAFNGKNLVAAQKQMVGNKEQYLNLENQLLFQNIKSLNSGKDTNALVKIFNPDPLTTARSEYVEPYLNYNKVDTPSLNNERKSLLLDLKLDSVGNFIAENNYVLIKDLDGPISPPFVVSNPADLVVTRNTDIFKQEMALYHIAAFQKYIQSLGFTNLKKQLWVDPIGDFGENSRFEFSTDTPYMLLGIGGIPDAEDADVITHEYGHALAFYLAPNTIEGEERIGIDEGNSDIMAVLYSRKLSDFNWRKVFNWDGNQTWSGRTTLNTKNYIDNFVLERYSLSAIWSGAVTDFAEQIGIDTTTTLLLTAMASLQTNMTIPTFAQLFLQADSILYHKYHFEPIKNSFFNRKLIESVSVENIDNEQIVKIVNTQGFASHNEPLTIQLLTNNKFDFSITDMQGKPVLAMKNQYQNAQINPSALRSGIYILSIDIDNQHFNFKIAKY